MHILVVDQGTTGTTTVLFDSRFRMVDRAYRELPQIYPKPGWVEHDPLEIWRTVRETVREIMGRFSGKVVALGISNQRETTMVWEREKGTPLSNAIVWQCRRTADACERLKTHEDLIRRKTGLPLDAYFSGTKIRWILDRFMDRDPGSLCFGNVDAWLIWNLTGGAVHATDPTNASRTMLYDIHAQDWDEGLCRLLDVPLEILPEVRNSSGSFGTVRAIREIRGIPILGVAGDQQAALFGQACFFPGETKNTYGTGCFAVMNTGETPVFSSRGLITTPAVSMNDRPCYALEGSIFIAGAAIQWLRDELGLLKQAAESEALARSVKDTQGAYLVPAFVGLGAPYWDMKARGALVGLTRGTNRAHIVRAALESMAFQSADVIRAMEQDSGLRIEKLTVDGGASANDFLMQFQADLLNRPVLRPSVIESTALGGALLAGLQAGVWKDMRDLKARKNIAAEFRPRMPESVRRRRLAGWRQAVRQVMTR